MDIYKGVRWVVTNGVRFGTAVTSGVACALVRNVNDTRVVKRWKQNDTPHKRPVEDAAVDLAFTAAGYVLGDKLADATGKWMDEKYEKLKSMWTPIETTAEESTEEEPVIEVL